MHGQIASCAPPRPSSPCCAIRRDLGRAVVARTADRRRRPGRASRRSCSPRSRPPPASARSWSLAAPGRRALPGSSCVGALSVGDRDAAPTRSAASCCERSTGSSTAGRVDRGARRRMARALPLAAGAGLSVPRRPPSRRRAGASHGGSRSSPRRACVGLIPFARQPPEPYDDVPSPMPVTFEGSFGLTVFWICWAGLLGGLFARRGRGLVAQAALDRRAPSADAVAELRRVPRAAVALQRMDHRRCSAATPTTSASSGSCCSTSGSRSPWRVAVTRHGLYGIERLINRTLVYGALTVALAAAYGVVVLVAGVVLGGSSAVRASLATLVVALAFRPAAPAAADARRLALRPARATRASGGCARSSTRSATDARSRRTSAPRSPRRCATRPPRCVYLLPASGA